MNIIQQSVAWFIPPPDNTMQLLELAGRVAYKSEARITADSAAKFIGVLLSKQHESVIEHVSASVRIITDRGVMAELTRHRICSFTVESTRYVNYAKRGLCFIEPVDMPSGNCYSAWLLAIHDAEQHYLKLLEEGATPQQARAVLPNSTKTELIMSANLRQWKYVLTLRTAKEAHPQMRALMLDVAALFHSKLPLLFPEGG